jgi:predicted DNA binding CopG/RHH family protein
MKPPKPIVLDKYEQNIEQNIRKFVPVSKRERKKIESIIASANKNKNINIRISASDLTRIREMSAEEGLPYQTFLTSIIHKYIAGRLVDENAILQSIKMMNGNTISPIKKSKSKQL